MAGRRCRVALAFSAFDDGPLPSVASFPNGWVDDSVHQAETVHGPEVGALLDPVKGVGPAYVYGGMLGGPPPVDGSDGTLGRQNAVVVLRDPVPRSGRVAFTLGGATDAEGSGPRLGLIGGADRVIAVAGPDHTYNLLYLVSGSSGSGGYVQPVDQHGQDATLALCWDRLGRVWVEVNDEIVIGPVSVDVDATSLRAFCQVSSGFRFDGGMKQDGIATLSLCDEAPDLPAIDAPVVRPSARTGWAVVATTTDDVPVAELPYQSLNTRWSVPSPAVADLSLDGFSPEAAKVHELRTNLHVFLDGVRRFKGRVVGSGDEISDTGHETKFSATDLRGVLAKRRIEVHARLNFTQVGAYDVLRSLIGDAQAMPDGDEGIRFDPDAGPGPLVTTSANVGDSVKAACDAVVEQIGGDWDIDQAGIVRLWPDGRGTHRADFVAHYDVNVSDLSRSVDSASFANSLRVSGSTDTAASYRTGPIGPEGRWERQVGDPAESVAATVAGRADQAFAQASTITPSYTHALAPNSGWTPGALWIGDTCRSIVRSGRLDIDATERVAEIAVTVGPDAKGRTATSVQVTFGGARPNVYRELAADRRRLSHLERR
jgi:hypothetical protein